MTEVCLMCQNPKADNSNGISTSAQPYFGFSGGTNLPLPHTAQMQQSKSKTSIVNNLSPVDLRKILSAIPDSDKFQFMMALAVVSPALIDNLFDICSNSTPQSSNYMRFIDAIESCLGIETFGNSRRLAPKNIDLWKCNICTYDNQLADKLCAMCDQLNPSAPLERTPSYEEAMRLSHDLDLQLMRQFICPVCQDPESLIDGSYLLDCQHRTCAECLPVWITSKVNSNEVAEEQLRCPYDRCECTITEQTVRELCAKDTYDKFLGFRQENYLLSRSLNGRVRKCPSDSCNYQFECECLPVLVPLSEPYGSTAAAASYGDAPDLFVAEDDDREYLSGTLEFHCPLCAQRYCIDCRANGGRVGPGHEGMTCEERTEQLQREASEREKFENWQRENIRGDEAFTELVRQEGYKLVIYSVFPEKIII